MYGMVKTHKADNPLRVIASGCDTVLEKLSILVEKTLHPLADRFNSKIKDTNDIIEVIDNINKSMLSENCFLVSFELVNMFPNIDNKSGSLSVKEAFTDGNFDVDSTQCIVDASEICLTCTNCKLNHQHFLKTDGTTQGRHRSCSFPDIAMVKYDSFANNFRLKPTVWKRFRDDISALLEYGTTSLFSFLDYLNTMDKTGNPKFTMEIAADTGLGFLDLKLKINEGNIGVDVYPKSTNSFSYATPST